MQDLPRMSNSQKKNFDLPQRKGQPTWNTLLGKRRQCVQADPQGWLTMPIHSSCHAQSRSLAIKTKGIEFLRQCLHKPRTSMQTLGTHCQVKVPPTTSQNKLSKVLPRSVVAGLANMNKIFPSLCSRWPKHTRNTLKKGSLWEEGGDCDLNAATEGSFCAQAHPLQVPPKSKVASRNSGTDLQYHCTVSTGEKTLSSTRVQVNRYVLGILTML